MIQEKKSFLDLLESFSRTALNFVLIVLVMLLISTFFPKEAAAQNGVRIRDKATESSVSGAEYILLDRNDYTANKKMTTGYLKSWILNDVGGAGDGDVVGPDGALNQHLVVFSGTSGKLIKQSYFDENDLTEMYDFYDTPRNRITAGANLEWVSNTLNYVADDVVYNYYCTTWGEVKNAVAASNAANGGNIYISGDIILTENVIWNLTGISFYGGANARWRALNTDYEPDGTESYVVTVTDGSPSFYNIQFRGSGGGASPQTFSTYSSRELFSVTSGDSDLIFRNCIFLDIVGGAGTNNIINYTVLNGSSSSQVVFNSCVISSHNNDLDFTFNGFKINCSNSSANFSVKVINQSLPLSPLELNNSNTKFDIAVTQPANFSFFSDGSAWAAGSVTSANTQNIIGNSRNLSTLDDADGLLIRDATTGQIYNITLLQLKTHFGL